MFVYLLKIKQELNSIHVTPQDDIVIEAKSNIQTTETEILLYDIYAENDRNAMSQERRILSLMHWMQMLRQDIEIQRRSKDGRECCCCCFIPYSYSFKILGIENLQGFCKQNQKFSSTVNPGDITVNRESVRLLLCLYEGSLYKIERMYNQLKHLPEPQYEHAQRYAKSSTDKVRKIEIYQVFSTSFSFVGNFNDFSSNSISTISTKSMFNTGNEYSRTINTNSYDIANPASCSGTTTTTTISRANSTSSYWLECC